MSIEDSDEVFVAFSGIGTAGDPLGVIVFRLGEIAVSVAGVVEGDGGDDHGEYCRCA